MVDELSKRVRIPYEFVCIGRDLQSLIVPIKVSMDNKWTLDKQILKTSLRQMVQVFCVIHFVFQSSVEYSKGVDMLDDAVFFDQGGVNGPNFDLEAKLIRFYVVVRCVLAFHSLSDSGFVNARRFHFGFLFRFRGSTSCQ